MLVLIVVPLVSCIGLLVMSALGFQCGSPHLYNLSHLCDSLLLTSWCTAKQSNPLAILESKPSTQLVVDLVNKFIIHKRTDYDTNCDFLQKGVLLTQSIT